LPPPGSPPGTPGAKSNRGCLIVGLVVSGLVVLVVAVLAALAVPAYRDYLVRSKVMFAVAEGRALQYQVEDFVANTDRCPRDGSEVFLPEAADRGFVAMTVGEAGPGLCTIDIELGGEGATSVVGEHILLSRDAAGDWTCSSALARREMLPPDCR
jgi:type IV pilus assembly protein PilA